MLKTLNKALILESLIRTRVFKFEHWEWTEIAKFHQAGLAQIWVSIASGKTTKRPTAVLKNIVAEVTLAFKFGSTIRASLFS